MKIVHRCDGGSDIGMGHLVRSTVLAAELQKGGHEVSFVTKELDGYSTRYLNAAGFRVNAIPDATTLSDQAILMADGDFVIVDSYSTDENFFKEIHRKSRVLTMVDYVHPFSLDVDALLMPHMRAEDVHFDAPANAVQLIGPQFLLLREQFRDLPERIYHRKVKDILITFGGADIHNLTKRAAESLSKIEALDVHFILGGSYSVRREEELRQISETAKYHPHFYRDWKDMAALIVKADIAIASMSTTAYELCACGTPVLGILTGEDQKFLAAGLKRKEAVDVLGWHDDVTNEQIAESVQRLIGRPDERKQLGTTARSVTDGKGVFRVVEAIERIGRNS